MLLREDIACSVDGEPQRRFSDAAELARRLRGLDERRAERARQADALLTQARQAEEFSRSEIRRRYLRATVGVLVLGLAGSMFLALQLWNSERARTVALGERPPGSPGFQSGHELPRFIVRCRDAGKGGREADRAQDSPGARRCTDRRWILGTWGTGKDARQPSARCIASSGIPIRAGKTCRWRWASSARAPQAEPIVTGRLLYWQAQADLAMERFPGGRSRND
ncbi:MAG: hypothetical protein WDM77_11415 [Steroidobacteraceae bacterium]